MELKVSDTPVEVGSKPIPTGNLLKTTLKDGRPITIRRMGPSHRMRMLSIIGAENSRNEAYLYSHAVPAFSVAELDGQPVPTPQNVLGLEGLADRLGDDALVEIMVAIGEAWGGDETKAILNEMAARQEIKN